MFVCLLAFLLIVVFIPAGGKYMRGCFFDILLSVVCILVGGASLFLVCVAVASSDWEIGLVAVAVGVLSIALFKMGRFIIATSTKKEGNL